MTKQRAILACTLAFLMVASCGTVTPFSYDVPIALQADNQLAKNIENPTTENGIIYVIRDAKSHGNLYATVIRIGGECKGVLSAGTFLKVELPPGTYKVSGRRFHGPNWYGETFSDSKKYQIIVRGRDLTNAKRLKEVIGSKVVLVNGWGGIDHEVALLNIKWKRFLVDEEGFFVKGFDRTIEISSREIVFLFFSEGTFFKKPVPVAILPFEDGKAMLQTYSLSGDIKVNGDDWAYGWYPETTGDKYHAGKSLEFFKKGQRSYTVYVSDK